MMYGTYKLDNFKVWGTPRISVVQGNIPQEFKWNPAYAREIIYGYDTLTREVSADKPDVIILPETAYPYLVDGEREAPAELKDLATKIDIPILVGVVYDDGDDFYNSALYLSGKGDLIGRYDKLHLVPFLQSFLPYLKMH